MKIALIGHGKMGRMIEEIARQRGHEIVAIVDVDNPEVFASPAFASADVAIEFTSPASAYENCRKAWAAGLKVVCGSTGWFSAHEAEVRRACTDEGKTLFWASNFSLGVALFAAMSRRMAELMNRFPQYDVRMREVHHVHKLDEPSGTAITLCEDLLARIDRKQRWTLAREKGAQTDASAHRLPLGAAELTAENLPLAELEAADGRTLEADELPIVAERRGEVAGLHSIVYHSDVDTIELTHSARSRRGFALGAVVAAEFTAAHTGLLSMNNLLDF